MPPPPVYHAINQLCQSSEIKLIINNSYRFRSMNKLPWKIAHVEWCFYALCQIKLTSISTFQLWQTLNQKGSFHRDLLILPPLHSSAIHSLLPTTFNSLRPSLDCISTFFASCSNFSLPSSSLDIALFDSVSSLDTFSSTIAKLSPASPTVLSSSSG